MEARSVKGHWPKGKRRHDADGVEVLIARTKRLLRNRIPNIVSQSALAKAIKVHPRSVGRWLRGEDCPAPTHKRAWKRWLDKQRGRR
jgi:hypothetical protein